MKITSFNQVVNWVKDAVSIVIKDTRSGFYRFGVNDDLPNQLIYKIHASGTAKSCVNRLIQFVSADGLIDRNLAITKANPKQTFDSFIYELANNVVYFSAVGFRVLYDNMGQPARFYALYSNTIRKKGSYFLYNELRGEKDFRSQEDKIVYEFNPDYTEKGETAQSRLRRVEWQIREYGQQIGDLVFIFKKSIGPYGSIYGMPDYYSEAAIHDIESDAAIARFDKRAITKGFRTPIIISTGPVDPENKDDNGKSDLDHLNDIFAKFTGEDAASVMHLQAASSEEMAKVTTIPIDEIMDAAANSRDRIAHAVCRHFNVPPVLIGFSTPGQLGNMQELVNQMKLMNMSVLGYQNMISNALQMVMPNNDWSLTTLKLFDYVPEWVLQKLSDDELREMFELKARKDEATQI